MAKKSRFRRPRRELRVRMRTLPPNIHLRVLALQVAERHAAMHTMERAFADRAAEFRESLREAYAAGLTPTQLGEAVGITRGRVHQLVRRPT